MFTSYFASRWWHGGNAVSIARGTPDWYTGRRYIKLAPPWSLVKSNAGPAEYEWKYNKIVLSRLNPKQVYRELGEDAILLCWEKPGDFCHRRLVAKWIRNELGIIIPEMKPKLRKKKPTAKQMCLF